MYPCAALLQPGEAEDAASNTEPKVISHLRKFLFYLNFTSYSYFFRTKMVKQVGVLTFIRKKLKLNIF
jgi:hypothetical protein